MVILRQMIIQQSNLLKFDSIKSVCILSLYNTTVFMKDNISVLGILILSQLFLQNKTSVSEASHCTMVNMPIPTVQKQASLVGRLKKIHSIYALATYVLIPMN